MKIQGKRAAMGESILMIYRLVLVSFIALVILGASAVFYEYYIDVKNVEARILNKQVINCLAPEGVFDYSGFNYEQYKTNLLDYCEIKNTERFYVKVNISSARSNNLKEKILEHGDSGAMWVKELFEKVNEKSTEKIAKYGPGYYNWTYTVNLNNLDKNVKGNLSVEVLVSHEF